MKIIKRLNERLDHFDEKADPSALPTIRQELVKQLGISLADNAEQAIDLFQLGLKIKNAGDSVSIEDSEFNLLRKVCEKNQLKWMSHFQAQILLLLKQAEAN